MYPFREGLITILIGILMLISSNLIYAENENLDILQKNVFGKWEITGVWALPFVSEFDENKIAAHMGRQFFYSENCAVSYSDYGDRMLEYPYYKLTSLVPDELRVSYRVNVVDPEFNAETITLVEILKNENCESSHPWDVLGDILFIKNEDTLILWNGAFFEMKRVEN